MSKLRQGHILELYLFVESELMQKKDITSFLIEKFKFRGKYYYSPCAMLSYMPFIEFIYIDTLLINYSETNKREYLHKMISVLYRLPEKNSNENIISDKRIKFTDSVIGLNQDIFSKIGVQYQDFIFYNYVLIRQWLGKIYPHVFSGDEVKVKTASNDGWLNVRDFLATSIADLDKVDNTPLHDVLRRLNNNIKNGKN